MSPKNTTQVDVAIGRRILAGRRRVGLTQSALANALGVTFQQVQKYENGKNRVSAARLQQIARLLKIEISSFGDTTAEAAREHSLDEALATKRAHELLLAWVRLKPEVRTRVLALVKAMADQTSTNVEANSHE